MRRGELHELGARKVGRLTHGAPAAYQGHSQEFPAACQHRFFFHRFFFSLARRTQPKRRDYSQSAFDQTSGARVPNGWGRFGTIFVTAATFARSFLGLIPAPSGNEPHPAAPNRDDRGTVPRQRRKSNLVPYCFKATQLSCFRWDYFFFSALLRSVIGLENTRHLLNQSDAQRRPIVTRYPAFSRVFGSLPVFTLPSHWLVGMLSFARIGCCDSFVFR